MSFGKFVLALFALGLCLVAAGVYSPETAERVYPSLGARAAQLRDLIPEDYRAKLPPTTIVAVAEDAKPAPKPAAKPAEKPAEKSKAAEGSRSAAPQRPPVTVLVGPVRKGPLPVRIDTIGTVQTVASVSLRTRVDAQIERVLVSDGASVKAGDVLVKLDSRQIEAQIRQAEATLAKDQAQLEQANRDVARFSDLLAHGTGIQLNFDNAKTTAATLRASIIGDEANISNLKVQLTWYTIAAPISGRVGTFSAKVGNIIRSGDNNSTGSLATINQTSPIYVAFSLPQAQLPDLRTAIAGEGAKATATPQGLKEGAEGKVAVIDNSIDATTGTITARALFENAGETLWPGQLCNVRVTLRTEPDVVTVPRVAVQNGQNGNFVFIVVDNVAKSRRVRVTRTQDDDAIIAEGLSGDETVVVDGANLLAENSRVDVRNNPAKKSAELKVN